MGFSKGFSSVTPINRAFVWYYLISHLCNVKTTEQQFLNIKTTGTLINTGFLKINENFFTFYLVV
jgi:hypothetical protein